MNTSPKSVINPKPSGYLLCMGNHISPSAAIPDTCLSPQVLFCQLSKLKCLLVFSFSPCHWNLPPLCLTFSWGRISHKLSHRPNCPLLLYDAEVWHRLVHRLEMSWFSAMKSIVCYAATYGDFQQMKQTCSLCLTFYKYDKLSGISTAADQSEPRGRGVGWVIGIKSKQTDWIYQWRL